MKDTYGDKLIGYLRLHPEEQFPGGKVPEAGVSSSSHNFGERMLRPLQVDDLYECCNRFYQQNGDDASVVSCPKASLLRFVTAASFVFGFPSSSNRPISPG